MKTSVKFRAGLAFLLCVCRLAAQVDPGTVLWSFDIGRTIATSPAVGQNGTVYVGSDLALYAITNNGSVASNEWTFNTVVSSSPAIAADGTICFAGGNNYLYALNPTGTQKWISTSGGVKGSPALGLDGTVYFIANGRLHAVEPSGSSKWSSVLEDNASFWDFVQSPVIGGDGSIYAGIADKFYAVSPYGTNKWFVNLDSARNGSPSVGENDTIYVSAGPLYAFNSEGTIRWAASPSNLKFDGPPVVGKDGKIYASGYQSHILYAFTSAGEVAWQALGFGTNSPATAPAIDAGGTLYHSLSNTFFALDPQGAVRWSMFAGFSLATTSPTIGPDGTLYATLGSKLYAIATGTNGPADSPWPMYRGNYRHTGKIEKPALKQPKKRADANFEFQLYAQLGQTNVIETTTNLSNWTSLTSVVVTTMPQPVVDLTASNSPSRIYRTVAP